MLAVRASGALSLLKVDKGDLWLQTSFDSGDSFEAGVRVNDVEGEVRSHAESSPQLQVRTMSEFYALWQNESSLRFARSMNWGQSFSKAIDVEPGAAQQSFYTMNVSPKGVIYVAWLDGRDRGKGRPGTSAVYLARSVDRGASFEKPVRVALDVCPCCRPNIGFSGDHHVHVTWRGVLENNVRDVFLATSNDDGVTWAGGKRVAEDNWVLNGCPHSGGMMAALGNRLFLTWYTVREKQPKLYMIYTDDGGKTFSQRIDLSASVVDPNHPFVKTTGDKISIVFQGRDPGKDEGWGPVSAYYREIDAKGNMSALTRLGHEGGSAAYPTLAFEEPGRIFVAWTEPAKDSKVIVLSRGRRAN